MDWKRKPPEVIGASTKGQGYVLATEIDRAVVCSLVWTGRIETDGTAAWLAATGGRGDVSVRVAQRHEVEGALEATLRPTSARELARLLCALADEAEGGP